MRKYYPGLLWCLLVALAATVIFALTGVRQWYRHNLEELIQTLAGEFPSGWLAAPNAQPEVFAEIEQCARRMQERHPSIRELVITYLTEGGGERVVFPLSRYLTGPPEEESGQWRRVSLQSGSRPIGAIYVAFDQTTRYWLDLFVWMASITLVILVAWLGLRLQRSAGQVRRTLDLLEQKQRQISQLQRLARVGQLSANLIHDLKKPMLNIREELAAWDAEISLDHVREQVELFRALLAEYELERFVGGPSFQPEYLDIQEMIAKALRLVSYERGQVQVLTHISDEAPFVWGIEHQVVQILSNLFSNAYRAMEGHGQLTVHVHGATRGGLRYVRTQIADTGPGIAPAHRSKVFEPFFTTGQGGASTGLGLYIVRSLAGNMGGFVEFETVMGQGTTFVVLLPAAAEPEGHN